MPKKKVAVLFGGRSGEHDISCLSAATVIRGLDPEKYELTLLGLTRGGAWLLADSIEAVEDGSWEQSRRHAVLLPEVTDLPLLITEEDGSMHREAVDVLFPVLHGRFGEDGTVQGLFELSGLPYVGSGVTASAVCMDKLYTKVVVAPTGIRQARYVGFTREELDREAAVIDKLEDALAYPVFVKPSDGGSSQGVSRVDTREELLPALRHALEYGTRAMVEECITGRELECAVLSSPEGAVVAGPGEILSAESFYTFDAKYNNPDSQVVLQPELPEGAGEELRRAALRIFEAIGGKGLARVDFFLEKDTNAVILNEVNTFPGFTSISMYPKLWEAAGLPLPQLLDRLIAAALQE